MLQSIHEPIPEPAHNEIRIRVLTAGVAFADVLCRTGNYPIMPKLPFSPGYDVVGIVDAAGDDVIALKSGQMVGAMLPKFGGYAEMVCVPAETAVPVPANVDPVDAVAIILNYLTADRLLHLKGKAQAGERVLVHSAAGGVGTAVLQLGKLAGLEMYGTASAGKHDIVTQFSGTPIDYRNEDFAQRIMALTGNGVDLVLDPIGGDTLVRSYNILRKGGRLINFGMFDAMNGNRMAFMGNVMRLVGYNLKPDGKRTSFFGSTPNVVNKELDWYRERLMHLFDLLANGRIQPVIGATLPLSDASKAQAMLENGQVRGKIVLKMD
ncbi:MAG: zinc-binding dehydrogenase [Chloroflexi bacterium]|nr:zinc-binding dehydrogenase [Chloroflexota bacterium]